MLNVFPKVISPKAHAIADLLAFPVMVGITLWMARRNKQAAFVMAVNTASEASIALTTNYPPAVIPLISFQNHIKIGIAYSPMSLALATLLPQIPKQERTILCLFPLVPFLLNSMSQPYSKDKQ